MNEISIPQQYDLGTGVLKVQPGIQVSAVGPEAPTKQADQQPAQKETA